MTSCEDSEIILWQFMMQSTLYLIYGPSSFLGLSNADWWHFLAKKGCGMKSSITFQSSASHCILIKESHTGCSVAPYFFGCRGSIWGFFRPKSVVIPDFLLQKCVEDKLTLDLMKAWTPFYFPRIIPGILNVFHVSNWAGELLWPKE